MLNEECCARVELRCNWEAVCKAHFVARNREFFPFKKKEERRDIVINIKFYVVLK